MIEVRCECGNAMVVENSFAGGVCKCDSCGAVIAVPEVSGGVGRPASPPAQDLSNLSDLPMALEPGAAPRSKRSERRERPESPVSRSAERRERPERPARPDEPPAPPSSSSSSSERDAPSEPAEDPEAAAMAEAAAAASGTSIGTTQTARQPVGSTGVYTNRPARRQDATALYVTVAMIAIFVAFIGGVMYLAGVWSDDDRDADSHAEVAPPPVRPAVPDEPPAEPRDKREPTKEPDAAPRVAYAPKPSPPTAPSLGTNVELLAHWPLGGGAKDHGPHDLKGEFKGARKFVDGPVGKATAFDGKTHIAIKSTEPFNKQHDELIVAAWVRLPAGKKQNIWAAFVAKGDTTWRLSVNNAVSGQFYFAVNRGSPTNSVATKSKKLNDGKWHHVVGVFDRGTMKMYLDGKLQNTNTKADKKISTSDRAIWISGNADRPGREINGSIDDVRIYRGAATAEQVVKLYRMRS